MVVKCDGGYYCKVGSFDLNLDGYWYFVEVGFCVMGYYCFNGMFVFIFCFDNMMKNYIGGYGEFLDCISCFVGSFCLNGNVGLGDN